MIKNPKKLSVFTGNVCTIFVDSINRNFKEECPEIYPKQLVHYFLGTVESVDEDGIMMRNIRTNLPMFFFAEHIVSIAQEEKLNSSNEEDAKIIEKIKNQKTNQNKFVDVESLTNLLRSQSPE